MPSSQRRTQRDDGSGTVLVLFAVVVLLTLTVAALAVGSAVVSSHRARLAADLGSLAGARSAQSGLSVAAVCAEAARVVRANRANVSSCSLAGADVLVVVTVPAWPTGAAVARALAGPARPR